MLLRFRVANALSMRDEQELSFVAPPGEIPDERPGTARAVELSDGRTLDVFPLLGIFGANASGKSNVLTALSHMQNAVLSSYGDWTSYRGLDREPFALDPSCAGENSFYEVDFVLPDGVRWTYGFELSDSRVEAEWLHAYPKGHRQEWLDRDASREREFRFPGERIHDRALLARTTRPDALLLSRAAADNHRQLGAIGQWFKDNLWSISPEWERAKREEYTKGKLEDPATRERIEELLRVADLGITGARLEQVPGGGRPKVRLLHGGTDGESVAVDWERESFGTRSWFALLGPLLLALDQGAVLLVDELDASLHPRFAAEVVRLFHDPRVNTRAAQLVFTSHDPSLLSAPGGGRLLDPGQVWLAEKDLSGGTELYPLTAAEPGEGEDLTRSYLEGVFGGIPALTEGQMGRRVLVTRATEGQQA